MGARRRTGARCRRGRVDPGRSRGIHGLLGPNGAGKTTTLKMRLGFVRPSGGTFRIFGHDSTRPAGRRGVGFMPEQPYIPQNLTAEQASSSTPTSGVSRDEIRPPTATLLERVDSPAGALHLGTFSRGMLQARHRAGLINRPQVVVLDEPPPSRSAGLRDVRDIMLSLRDEGVTVLLIAPVLEVETCATT
jgi:ABC-2 type transport system ATP-binding protein